MGSQDGLEIELSCARYAIETYRATSLVDFSTGIHFHDAIQILLITTGERIIETRGGLIHLREGDCLIIPEGEPHRGWNVDGRPASFKSLYIRNMAVENTPWESLGAVFIARKASGVQSLNAFIDVLTNSMQGTLERTLSKTVLEMFESMPTCDMVTAAQIGTMRRIKDDIISYEDVKPSIEILARSHGISKCHLVHAFSRVYGLSPYAYNIRHRINLARLRLARGIRPVEVALELGFYDQSHFGSHFRAVTGLSPAHYQRKILHRI